MKSLRICLNSFVLAVGCLVSILIGFGFFHMLRAACKISHEVNMEKCRRVAVYGNSLNMAGIVASLKADTTLEVLCVDLDSPNARQSLDENNLAASVFDLSDLPLHLDGTLLRHRPGLLLIGVDPSKDEMLVLSSHPEQALSVADLVKVIRQKDAIIKISNREP